MARKRNKDQDTDVSAEEEQSTEEFEAPEADAIESEDLVDTTEEAPAEEPVVAQPQPTTTQVKEAEATDRLTASVKDGLDQYVANMALNKPNSTKEMARNQSRLNVSINQALNADPSQFKELWQMIIEYFRAHRKGVFGEHAIFRAWNEVPLAGNDRQRLEQVLNLLMASADSSNPRQVTSVVDLNIVQRYLSNETQRQNLMSYYNAA